MKRRASTLIPRLGIAGAVVLALAIPLLDAEEMISNLQVPWLGSGIGDVQEVTPGLSFGTGFTTGPETVDLAAVTIEETVGPVAGLQGFHVRLCQPAYVPMFGLTMSLVAELGNPQVDPTPTQWPGGTVRVAYHPAAPLILQANTPYVVVVSEDLAGVLETSVLFAGSLDYTAAPGWQMDADYTGYDLGFYQLWTGPSLSGHLKFNVLTPTVNPPTPTNAPPDISAAYSTVTSIWPPNGKMVHFNIAGVIDPDGDPVQVTVTAIQQDEPLTSSYDTTAPDGRFNGSNGGCVRAERLQSGNGRVYTIWFEASDGKPDGVVTGAVQIIVPHDQGREINAVDDGPLTGYYDSTVVP